MALPFFNPLFNLLPDGGIYDPESGLSYTGPGARTISGQPLDPTTVPTETTPRTQELVDFYLTGKEPTPLSPTAPRTITGATTERDASGNLVQIITYSDGSTERTIVELASRTNPQIAADAAINAANKAATNKNAREFLIASLRPYFASASDAGFLKDLESLIDDYIKQDYDADTISVLLPQTKPYQERFKGNIARATAGLSQLSPAEYIRAEEQYNEVLKRFNLGSLSSRDTFASLISGQVSAAELTDRVVNVYDRIRNADPALKAELDRVRELSAGQLSEADFAKALLTGDTGANELKRKISTAEISAEARTRGLETTRAQQLEQLGVTREQARAGFEQIGLTQPRLTQLSEIYDKTTPDASGVQEELEREQFQGMQSQRRRRLSEQEQTAFMGQSGTAGSQSLGRRRAGSI
jgi:hypothetical protein